MLTRGGTNDARIPTRSGAAKVRLEWPPTVSREDSLCFAHGVFLIGLPEEVESLFSLALLRCPLGLKPSCSLGKTNVILSQGGSYSPAYSFFAANSGGKSASAFFQVANSPS
jgi:hypothetical protein